MSSDPPNLSVTFCLTCGDFTKEYGALFLALGLVSLDGQHYGTWWTWVGVN